VVWVLLPGSPDFMPKTMKNAANIKIGPMTKIEA
jgi:hypothetical protein